MSMFKMACLTCKKNKCCVISCISSETNKNDNQLLLKAKKRLFTFGHIFRKELGQKEKGHLRYESIMTGGRGAQMGFIVRTAARTSQPSTGRC